MSKVFYQLELSNVLRKQSSCTRTARLPTHNCSSEHGAGSSGNAQVRNGHFLVSNFATVKQAWIQISFCVSLNFAGTMSSTISVFQMDFFLFFYTKERTTHSSNAAGEMKSGCMLCAWSPSRLQNGKFPSVSCGTCPLRFFFILLNTILKNGCVPSVRDWTVL